MAAKISPTPIPGMASLETLPEDELVSRKLALLEQVNIINDELEKRRKTKRQAELKENEAIKLNNQEIKRYSRQLLLPNLSVPGQLLLKSSSVLIVGCGGLGCPAAMFLAAAGCGTLGLVDYDTVEDSNLHRQVLHSEDKLGMGKAESVRRALTALNSHVQIRTHVTSLRSGNALELIREYDVILDASDNVATRYLLNDACVLAQKTLVSGSALRFEGQLTVYNYRNTGPTYRCLFPEPPPPETVTNCSDGGVLGVIPGVIGSLQALEAIKILVNIGEVLSGKMLLFDGLDGKFRSIKLRPRQADVNVKELIDYEQFCGTGAHDKDEPLALLDPGRDRISVQDLKGKIDQVDGYDAFLLIDVRSKPEMAICSLPSALNVPLGDIDKAGTDIRDRLAKINSRSVFVMCRRGNDSQKAVQKLRALLNDGIGEGNDRIVIKDVIGGLHSWAEHIDVHFPCY